MKNAFEATAFYKFPNFCVNRRGGYGQTFP